MLRLQVTNKHTGEVRTIKLSEDFVTEQMMDSVNRCTGPCECEPIEPDAYCAHGWPSTQEAIIENCA